jgi:hypothetical protein
MRNIRLTAIAILAMLALVPCWLAAQDNSTGAAGSLADTKENRLAQAARCVEFAPTEVVAKMACGRIASLRADISEDQRPEFIKAMLAELDLKAMNETRVQIMAKHLTVAELTALGNFYETPEGRTAWTKLGDYVLDMQTENKPRMVEAEAKARQALGLPASP